MNEFYLHIDSNDRVSGTIENFRYQYTNRNVELASSYAVTLKKLEFPAGCIYQVNSTNNIFRYNINGVNYTFSAEFGNYTIPELLNSIQTHINATVSTNSLATGITCSYDVIKNKVRFIKTNNTLTAYIWGGGLMSGQPSMVKLLGLGSLDQIVLSSTTVTILPDQIDMSPLDYVFIRCNQLNVNDFVNDRSPSNDILYKVQLASDRNSKLYIDESNLEQNMLLLPRLSSSLQFSVTDRNGNQVSLHGIDYSMTLRFVKI
jgi:hypothetical protein